MRWPKGREYRISDAKIEGLEYGVAANSIGVQLVAH